MVIPVPKWARPFALGEVTATDLHINPPLRDYARGSQYVLDTNPPTTRVYLEARTWARVCATCGWPLDAEVYDDTHPTCVSEVPC